MCVVKLLLRQCEENDYAFILDLRNEFRDQFFNSDKIVWIEHTKFMDTHKDTYYICEDSGHRVGFIGIVGDDIRLCVHREHQGKGIGKFMLRKIYRMYPNAKGRIKESNHSSIATFEAAEVPYERI